MPSCALRYCFNNSRNIKKSQGVTFHNFPGPCHEKRESWIKFVQNNRSEETWLPSDYSRICSVHFKKDDKYTTKTGRVYLKKSAVPCDNPTECGEPEVSELVSESKTGELSEELEDSSDNDNDTSDDTRDGGVTTRPKPHTNRKRHATDTETGPKSDKHTRLAINDFKIDYDNIDVFGQQMAFLLKRLPRQLCRELQDSIVTLVKTATKKHESTTNIDAIPSTSSGTKVIDVLSQIVFTPTLVAKPNINKEITIKEEPDDKLDEEESANEPTQATQYKEIQIKTLPKPSTSTIKTFPKPMTVPIELVGSMDCMKKEVFDPGETSNITVDYRNNKATTLELTLADPLPTDIKIEIDETALSEEARRADSD